MEGDEIHQIAAIDVAKANIGNSHVHGGRSVALEVIQPADRAPSLMRVIAPAKPTRRRQRFGDRLERWLRR